MKMRLQIEERSGSKYYHYKGSYRLKGKVKSKKIYLGKEERAIQILAEFTAKRPDQEKLYSYSGEVILEEIAKRLKFSKIVNKHVKNDTEWDIGEFIKILVIERCLFPVSKWAIAETYFKESFMAIQDVIPSKAFSVTNIYNYMNYIHPYLHDIHADLVNEVYKLFPPKNEVLILDGTSLPCYGSDPKPSHDELDENDDFNELNDTENDNYEDLPVKRILRLHGYSRSKRPDLAQVNVMLGVNQRHIPLYFDVFAGNTTDLEMFKYSLSQLQNKYTGLLEKMKERFLIFDRGNLNSKNTQNLDRFCEEWNCHFIGGVKSVAFKEELRQLETEQLTPIFSNGDTVLHGITIDKEVYGKTRKVLLYVSRAVRKHKLLEFQKKLEIVLNLLNEINIDDKLSSLEKVLKMRVILRKYSMIHLFWLKKFDKEGKAIFPADVISGIYQLRPDKVEKKIKALGNKSGEFKDKLKLVQSLLAEIAANQELSSSEKVAEIQRTLRKYVMVRLFWLKKHDENGKVTMNDISESTLYKLLPLKVMQKKSLFGKFVVISNKLDLSASQIIQYYKTKEIVEHEFHLLKSILKIHPQYHYREPKIDTHITIVQWGMLFLSVLRCFLEDNGLRYSFEELTRIIKQGILQKAIYCYPDFKNFLLTRITGIKPELENIMKLLKIKPQFFDIDNMVLQ